MYVCAVLMLVYCVTSVYRVSYFMTSVLLLLAICASTLKYSAKLASDQAPPQRERKGQSTGDAGKLMKNIVYKLVGLYRAQPLNCLFVAEV